MVNLGSITTPTEEEHFKGKGPLPADWYKEASFVSNKEEEPSPYRLIFDFMIGGAMDGIGNVMGSSGGTPMLGKLMGMFVNMPPVAILIETAHPTRGLEHVRLRLSPFAIYDGPPEVGSNIEPDIIMRMNYYDFVRMLTGDIGFVDPICDGLATVEGNLMSMMQFGGMFDTIIDMVGFGGDEEGGEGGEGGMKITDLLGGK
ncbi:MAG: hypothetical protein SVK08_03030 [Halobacteriota archaeon]|nr:hypothetical protein [Halobacteriota archaeon]